jgi:hypothetical protein
VVSCKVMIGNLPHRVILLYYWQDFAMTRGRNMSLGEYSDSLCILNK